MWKQNEKFETNNKMSFFSSLILIYNFTLWFFFRICNSAEVCFSQIKCVSKCSISAQFILFILIYSYFFSSYFRFSVQQRKIATFVLRILFECCSIMWWDKDTNSIENWRNWLWNAQRYHTINILKHTIVLFINLCVPCVHGPLV